MYAGGKHEFSLHSEHILVLTLCEVNKGEGETEKGKCKQGEGVEEKIYTDTVVGPYICNIHVFIPLTST